MKRNNTRVGERRQRKARKVKQEGEIHGGQRKIPEQLRMSYRQYVHEVLCASDESHKHANKGDYFSLDTFLSTIVFSQDYT